MKIIFERAAANIISQKYGMVELIKSFSIAFRSLEPLQTEWRCCFEDLNSGMINIFYHVVACKNCDSLMHIHAHLRYFSGSI